MNKELYIHTLSQFRDECKRKHMDTETEAFNAAIQALSADGDCISRQAAIDAVRDRMGKGETNIGDTFIECFEMILNALPSAQPEQQWIPVVKKPIEKGLMLVTYNDGDVDLLKQPTAYRRSDIVAWMPIEPWRGEEHEHND